ncbi:hypothetical protein DMH04_15035 [Kibdelosporangium aridum]|uniref:Uncharacterized protein n=1 Tax=Kibdelosporangium aridum TaxID=2030 RepID=A0A428ZDE1_KIBAR|nr:hypothetical protein DMH04_15035 [Kibdelosporangium aridum]
MAARSAALRSTQNSLPSGSASTTQPVPSGRRKSSSSLAPSPCSRSTSSSRVVSGCRQMCIRLRSGVLASGTCWKNMFMPPPRSIATSGSPGLSTSSICLS